MTRYIRHLLLLIAAFTASVAGSAAEQWRLHPTYAGDAYRLIPGKKYVYVVSNNQIYTTAISENATPTRSLFRYDPKENETVHLNVSNKLSSHVVTDAAYNPQKGYLLVYYSDGNIDMLYDSGEVVNIPGLKLADASVSRNINFVSFDPNNDRVYLATDFGYIEINDLKKQIGTTRRLGERVNAVAAMDKKIFIALDRGLFYIDPASERPTELQPTELTTAVHGLYPNSYRMLYTQIDGMYSTIGQFNSEIIEPGYHPETHFRWRVLTVDRHETGWSFCGPSDIWVFTHAGPMVRYHRPDEDVLMAAATYDMDSWWVNRGVKGICRDKVDAGTQEWTPTGETFMPVGSQAFKCTWMAHSPEYGMLVRNHGTQYYFPHSRPLTPDYISGLKNLEWTPYSLAMRTPGNTVAAVNHPNGLAIDPNNRDEVWCGSQVDGLSRINLKDASRSMRIGRVDDPAAGKPGFVAFTPVQEDFVTASNFSVPAFDKSGNMWVAFYDYNNNRGDKGILLWCWPPESRLASTSADFRAPAMWNVPGTKGSDFTRIVALTHSSNGGRLLLYQQTVFPTILLIDPKGTPTDGSDDEIVKVPESFIDQDGSSISYNNILVMKEDPSTGYVWVGTDMGVFYFSPSRMIKGDTRVTRVKVARNDGTNLADYLLDGAAVNDIAYDPKGRRWFALHGGGLVCTSAGGDEVLQSVTTSNSDIPDDIVYALCYNPDNNSFMVSTDSGLAEMYLPGSGAHGSENSVKIYPNPARPDYYGYVTIEGLEEGALVKIADSAGNMIKELGITSGDTAQWDMTNYNHKRVRSGVYYILSSATGEGESFSNVGKVVVIN